MATGEDEYLKKSEEDPRILDAILQQPMATDWNGGDYRPHKLIRLDESSLEYKRIKLLFGLTNYTLIINTIDRVENPFLLGQYLMKKEKMNRQKGSVKERLLFHGTRKSNVDGICRFNFDWRRCGRSRGHKFGQGVSFTPEVSYAQHYTSNEYVIFLAKVLVSSSTTGNHFTKIPPGSCDTTDNGKSTVYVKYEDDDFYPLYVFSCIRLI